MHLLVATKKAKKWESIQPNQSTTLPPLREKD